MENPYHEPTEFINYGHNILERIKQYYEKPLKGFFSSDENGFSYTISTERKFFKILPKRVAIVKMLFNDKSHRRPEVEIKDRRKRKEIQDKVYEINYELVQDLTKKNYL